METVRKKSKVRPTLKETLDNIVGMKTCCYCNSSKLMLQNIYTLQSLEGIIESYECKTCGCYTHIRVDIKVEGIPPERFSKKWEALWKSQPKKT